jgi:nitrogen regulatory protein P-II 1
MKKIEAIIRNTKFEEVKEKLNDSGIEFFSFWQARGVGIARESRV